MQALRHRAGLSFGQLFGGQGDAGDFGAVIAGQCERHAAPAAADVQYLQPGAVEFQLGGDQALFGDLRLLQRFVPGGEIGAGILPVAVEEEGVEPAVEVVMMRDVALGAGGGVELGDAAGEAGECVAQAQDAVAALGVVQHQHVEHVVNRAADWAEAAVHVGFADGQCRVEGEVAEGGTVAQRDRGGGAGATLVGGGGAVGPGHT